MPGGTCVAVSLGGSCVDAVKIASLLAPPDETIGHIAVALILDLFRSLCCT